jgi:methylmalonyl-CoA mutase
MPVKAFNSSLFESFAKQNKDVWQRIAAQETESDDPAKILSWKSENGLLFFPYYDESDVAHLHYLDNLRLTVGEDSFLGNRKWLNAPIVTVDNETTANKISLNHLNQGADGLFFDINTRVDFEKLLLNIEFAYCSLFFHSKNQDLHSLSDFIDRKKIKTISGALFWDTIPKKSDIEPFIDRAEKFKSLGIIIPKSDTITEIVEALLAGVKCIESFKSSFELKAIFDTITFSMEVNQNFFESVSKLKALRMLWYQISQIYGVKTFQPSDLYLHARSEKWIEEKFQPHGNMLKATTASMAAIIGGCDALTVLPEDGQQSMMNRISKNVSSILREESHLNKVADPLAGAYAVDVMVDSVAKEAWKSFQSKVTS